MRNILFVLSMLLFISLTSCQKKEQQKLPETLKNGEHKAMVSEVLQANSYTYLKVDENGMKNWLAVTKRDLEPGVTVYFRPELQMENFNSKDLNRTFEKIYFVNALSLKPLDAAPASQQAMSGRPAVNHDASISVEPADGGLTIVQISQQRNELANKEITVRGQVTKYNPNIMKRNWVHIQDGTKDGSVYDLTITTKDAVKKGDIVTFKGKVVLNKDFGAGYKYDIIMEEASLQK